MKLFKKITILLLIVLTFFFVINNSGIFAKYKNSIEKVAYNVNLDVSSVVVTFDKQSGTGGTDSVSAINGSAMPSITAPTRTGYTFQGYFSEANGSGTKYYNSNGTSARNYDRTVNTTLYAYWTVNNYSLTINHYLENANDTNYTLYNTTTDIISYGTTVTLANKTATVTNGTYAYGTNSSGTTVTTITMGESSTINLYYARDTYTLSLNKNSYVSTVTGAGTYKVGASVTISATLGSATGYTYSWTNWSSSNTSLLANQSSQSTTITMPQGAVTLTANGSRTGKTYIITYKDVGNANFSGTHASGYPTVHTYGTETTLKTATKTNYTFNGWFTNSSGTGTAVTSLGATAYTSNITLYAKWTANSYTITYNKNSGTILNESNYTNYTYGVGLTLPTPTRTGYTFNGWYENSSLTGTAITSISTTDSGNKTYYAKWTANSLTATQLASNIGYYVNYGSVIDAATSKTIYSSGTYNGSNASLSWTRQDLKWRILDVDTSNNIVRLIAATSDTQTLTLSGANGYNNAVKILNMICGYCYSSSTLGVTARSIAIEDLERHGAGTASATTITSMTYHSTAPAISQYEQYQWPLGESVGTHNLGRSNQYSSANATAGTYNGIGDWVTGTVSYGSSYKHTMTWYNYSLSSFINTTTAPYYAIFSNQTGTSGASNSTTYWLASRCVRYSSDRAAFYVFYVGSSYLYAYTLYYSYGRAYSIAYAVRPVVEIPLSTINIGESGSGTIDNPYSIAKK